jgi:hypothetical protein
MKTALKSALEKIAFPVRQDAGVRSGKRAGVLFSDMGARPRGASGAWKAALYFIK